MRRTGPPIRRPNRAELIPPGGSVVRAKSTDRAEARRRYRAATAAVEARARPRQPGRQPRPSRGSTPARAGPASSAPSGGDSAGNLKADLRTCPASRRRTFAIWVPALLMVVCSWCSRHRAPRSATRRPACLQPVHLPAAARGVLPGRCAHPSVELPGGRNHRPARRHPVRHLRHDGRRDDRHGRSRDRRPAIPVRRVCPARFAGDGRGGRRLRRLLPALPAAGQSECFKSAPAKGSKQAARRR